MYTKNYNIVKALLITWAKYCEHVGWNSDVPGEIGEGYIKNMII